MAKTPSNVYDLVHSSPVTLKEISSIVVAFELWRQEIEKYCENNSSDEFNLVKEITLSNLIPELPLQIHGLLKKHITRCRMSITPWLKFHSAKIFNRYHPNYNDVLKNFHDFAYDWNGLIHYCRTAKRMMLCDRLCDEEKFKIACKYCFEHDIREIWPSVSSNLDLDEIDFDECPLLFYWICRLRNELDQVPIEPNQIIDELMFDKCRSEVWSSMEYFWNRIPSEIQLQKAIDMSANNFEIVARFILPKLNEHQLDEFIAETGNHLILNLLLYGFDKTYILPTWMFIRNKIDESNFINLIEKFLIRETNSIICKEQLNPRDDTFIFCEIWKTVPSNLKQSVLKNILSKGELFERGHFKPTEPREMKFLITILLDASIEQKNEFWRKNWFRLIIGARLKDLQGIMKLCFENEDGITQFKQNISSEYENMLQCCGKLLRFECFEELNDLLLFCYPDLQMRREFTQQLLRQKFLGADSIFHIGFLRRTKFLNDFIDDTFDNADLATDFKNKLVSTPTTENCLLESIRLGYFGYLMEFVNAFVSVDQPLVGLKKRLFDSLRRNLFAGTILKIDADDLKKILVWCLGSEDEVDKFKRSIKISI